MKWLHDAWAWMGQHLGLVLLVVGLLLAIAGGVVLVLWLRKRQSRMVVGAPLPMTAGRLVQIRRSFLGKLPWLNRAAVQDLPTVVVLGPAASGKSRLIELDVDWRRQAHQFLPSFKDEPLLQIFLGPDSVVQEVSAPLLEDDSPMARRALRRLWSASFSRQQRGLAVIALNVHWLSDSPPDEVRRTSQLLRGKLNLISEMCNGPVEVRICLTHMDELTGYTDFAQLLLKNGGPLYFSIPQRGNEAQLASLLQAQEQYLALGLTSLPVDAFERLERFYSAGGRSFEALARFVTALLEGSTLSFRPTLSRVYFSTLQAETRAAGVLEVPTQEVTAQSVRARYLRTHLLRAAAIAAVCTLPVMAAYANFYLLLRKTEQRLRLFDDTVEQMESNNHDVSGAVVEQQVIEAGRAMDELARAMRYWPPLRNSFPKERAMLRDHLALGIREAHLKPSLQRCAESPEVCRPEQVVYLLAILHASREDELGKYILGAIKHRRQWLWTDSNEDQVAAEPSQDGAGQRNWISSMALEESLIADYVQSSDRAWAEPEAGAKWSHWPYKNELTLRDQLKPWRDHLKRVEEVLRGPARDLKQLEDLRAEQSQLQEQLDDSELFADLKKVLTLMRAPGSQVDVRQFKGIESTEQALEWIRANHEALSAVLRTEEEAYQGLKAVEKMSAAELLTRDGLWTPSTGNGPFRITVLQETFEYRPQELSREMIGKLIEDYETKGRMPFRDETPDGDGTTVATLGGARDADGEGATEAGEPEVVPIKDRLQFDTRIKPLVDEFTQRLKKVQLPPEEAAQRQEYVRSRMDQFAQGYRAGLYETVNEYHFMAPPKVPLIERLANLTQPSSTLVDMLREVATRANMEPLEGTYYEPLRNAVAPFKPVIQLMAPDKSGNYPGLTPYRALVSQLHDELNAGKQGVRRKAAKPADGAKTAEGASAADGASAVESAKGQEGDKASEDKVAGDKAPGDKAPGDKAESQGPAQLKEMLSPLGQVALTMMLDEESSYLRKVDAWLDQQGLIGALRQPFRQPFLAVRDQGRQELEAVLARQWSDVESRMLWPMFRRYPFVAKVTDEVEPGELEVLRRKDGAFWQFVERVVAPVCVERGADWAPRGPLRNQLKLPPRMLTTLSRLSRMSRVLWEDDGRPRPLALQVLPLPLPPPPDSDSFVTMASLKCGQATAFGYNQSPSWQEFSLSWWSQQTASIVLELRSPKRESLQYRSLEKSRSSWSCFRLLEESLATGDQHRVWRLVPRGTKDKVAANKQAIEITFGVKGEPWTLFREVPK